MSELPSPSERGEGPGLVKLTIAPGQMDSPAPGTGSATDSPRPPRGDGEEGEEDEEEEEDPMAAMMGFGGFGTTKVSCRWLVASTR